MNTSQSSSLLPDLLSLRELLAMPERWTTKCYARDAAGIPIETRAEEAASFCLDGAILRACRGSYSPVHNALQAAGTGTGNFAAWNDSPARTHSEVLALTDKAIEAARAAHTTT